LVLGWTPIARTAIGSFGRSLREIPPTELGATVAGVAIERAGLEPGQVEQVVFGNVIHTAPEDMYMARVVGIRAGIPKEAPAFTVNRLCGSGVQAIVSAAQAIQTGDAEIVLAGGAESMSRGAYWVENARWGPRVGDTAMIDAVVGCLTDPFNEIHMGVTAENVAASHGISRDAQDEFALESHRRAQVAIEAGLFDEEVVPIEVKARAQELSAPVRARILSFAVCGVEPKTMGIGPVPAVRKALERAGKALDDIDVIELNEAFAAVRLPGASSIGGTAARRRWRRGWKWQRLLVGVVLQMAIYRWVGGERSSGVWWAVVAGGGGLPDLPAQLGRRRWGRSR
jgi:acetyl-CoA C-acetyltransferase